MKKIMIPEQSSFQARSVNQGKLKDYLIKSSKAPAIKEQLVLKAYEITEATKVFYDTEDVILLYSSDETGVYLSCLNKGNEAIQMELPLAAMQLTGMYTAYCVLTAEDICIKDEKLNLLIPDRGILLIKLMPVK